MPKSSSIYTPLNYLELTTDQFNIEIEKGLASIEAGEVVSSEDVRKKMQQQYDL